MPTYKFRNKETNEVTEEFMKISELDEYRKNNPHLETVIVSNNNNLISQKDGTLSKTSSDWRNHLSNIKKTSGRGNTIKTY